MNYLLRKQEMRRLTQMQRCVGRYSIFCFYAQLVSLRNLCGKVRPKLTGVVSLISLMNQNQWSDGNSVAGLYFMASIWQFRIVDESVGIFFEASCTFKLPSRCPETSNTIDSFDRFGVFFEAFFLKSVLNMFIDCSLSVRNLNFMKYIEIVHL